MEFAGYKKGINLGGWLSQCNHEKQHYDSFIGEQDIKRIASWGLDHVRLPIDYEVFLSDDGEWKQEGFHYIDSCIDWCRKYNLNMILDLHKTVGYIFDQSVVCRGFFYSEELQDKFVMIWEELSRRYGRYSDFIAFELLNEVVDVDISDIWNRIARRALVALRKNAPDTYVIIGGARNNAVSCVKMLDLPYDDRIVYTFHFYEPLIFTHQSAYWMDGMPQNFSMVYPGELDVFVENTKKNLSEDNCEIYNKVSLKGTELIGPVLLENEIMEAILIAKERNVRLYCGEYGVIDQADPQSALRWYRDVHAVFEKHNISRAAWTYKEKDFGIVDPHYSDVRDELVKLL